MLSIIGFINQFSHMIGVWVCEAVKKEDNLALIVDHGEEILHNKMPKSNQ